MEHLYTYLIEDSSIPGGLQKYEVKTQQGGFSCCRVFGGELTCTYAVNANLEVCPLPPYAPSELMTDLVVKSLDRLRHELDDNGVIDFDDRAAMLRYLG